MTKILLDLQLTSDCHTCIIATDLCLYTCQRLVMTPKMAYGDLFAFTEQKNILGMRVKLSSRGLK